jgi:hypothetical protein
MGSTSPSTVTDRLEAGGVVQVVAVKPRKIKEKDFGTGPVCALKEITTQLQSPITHLT